MDTNREERHSKMEGGMTLTTHNKKREIVKGEVKSYLVHRDGHLAQAWKGSQSGGGKGTVPASMLI